MKCQAELADSLAEINRADKEEIEKKKAGEVEILTSTAPAAVKKYREKDYDANKLTKVEIASVLIGVYCVEIAYQKVLKKVLVDALNDKHGSDPKKLDDYRID